MKKYILPVLLFMFLALTPRTICASSNMEVSTSADFSAETSSFTAGQSIFVRVKSSSLGSKRRDLNLRDNQYNLLNTFKLGRDGSYYFAIVPAPYAAGYYSLEAQIESEGSTTTSVKTVKVGNVANADVRVKVDNKTDSSEVLGESSKQNADEPMISSPQPEWLSSDSFDDYMVATEKKGVAGYLSAIFKEVLDFLWPFD